MTLSQEQVVEILSHHPYPAFESFADSTLSLNENLSDEDISASFEQILKDFELTEDQKQKAKSISLDDQRKYYFQVINEDRLTPSPKHMRDCLEKHSDPRLFNALHSQFRKNRISYRRDFLDNGGFELLTSHLKKYSQDQEISSDIIGCFNNILSSNELSSTYFQNESQKELFSIMFDMITKMNSNTTNNQLKKIEEENKKLKAYAGKLKNASHVSHSKRFEQKSITDQLKKDKAEIERLRYELELLRKGLKLDFNGPTTYEYELLKTKYNEEHEKNQFLLEQTIQLRKQLNITIEENQKLKVEFSVKENDYKDQISQLKQELKEAYETIARLEKIIEDLRAQLKRLNEKPPEPILKKMQAKQINQSHELTFDNQNNLTDHFNSPYIETHDLRFQNENGFETRNSEIENPIDPSTITTREVKFENLGYQIDNIQLENPTFSYDSPDNQKDEVVFGLENNQNKKTQFDLQSQDLVNSTLDQPNTEIQRTVPHTNFQMPNIEEIQTMLQQNTGSSKRRLSVSVELDLDGMLDDGSKHDNGPHQKLTGLKGSSTRRSSFSYKKKKLNSKRSNKNLVDEQDPDDTIHPKIYAHEIIIDDDTQHQTSRDFELNE